MAAANADATNDNVQLLLMKVMRDRFCRTETHNLDACIENYVPQKVDGSYIDQSLQRRGLKRCGPYQEESAKCMSDEKKHSAIIQAATKVSQCNDERVAMARCQRAHPGKPEACERETLETLMCGLVYIVQKQSKMQQQQPQQ